MPFTPATELKTSPDISVGAWKGWIHTAQVEVDQILLDVLTLAARIELMVQIERIGSATEAAVPPYPWGQLIYHEVLQQRLKSGHVADRDSSAGFFILDQQY